MKKTIVNSIIVLWLLGSVIIVVAVEPKSATNRLENAADFAGTLIFKHPYLLQESSRKELDKVNRLLRETLGEIQESEGKTLPGTKISASIDELTGILEKADGVITVSVDRDELKSPVLDPLELPGDNGAVLLRIDNGPGEDSFRIVDIDLTREPGRIEIDGRTQGTIWTLISLSGVPADQTYLRMRLKIDDERTLAFAVVVFAAGNGRIKLNVLSDDTGKPIPSMVKIIWQFNGQGRQPSNALDFADQFDAQGSSNGQTGRRYIPFPEHLAGEYWCMPEPLDMALPPGEWEIAIRRGVEHIPIVDSFTVESGKTTERTYRPRRWVDMRKLGWYSGDDHVHGQILSDEDARKLMAWIKAEDVHLANIVKMGDIDRTYFQQRGFGRDFRVIDGDYILAPGQECPRTEELGHTLAFNVSGMVRNTDKYYLYDWVFDQIHAQGGLTGYAHAGWEGFQVHRDASLNIPKGKIDFAEILQFAQLGTGFYYDFLNLGYKLTASAGSDVPWGGTVGEVRLYAYTGDKPFSADTWFDAVRRGRTFVTNGPMIEFSVDNALPGDEVKVKKNRPLKVRARTWGRSGNFVPTKLEVVLHGEVIKSLDSEQDDMEELSLDFTVYSGKGFWIAARAEASDGSTAHTTPVYVTRDSLRFWKLDAVEQLLARRIRSLDEIEAVVEAAKFSGSIAEEDKEYSGLVGIWYGGSDLTSPKDIDLIKTPNIDWDSARRGKSWSARWTGSIIGPYSGKVIFNAKADSGLIVEIDGKSIVHYEHRKGKLSGDLIMEKGKEYPVTITYSHDMGEENYLEILWNWMGQDQTPISEKDLSHTSAERRKLRGQFGLTREAEQLVMQGDQLQKKVAEARHIYEDLRSIYLREQNLRESMN